MNLIKKVKNTGICYLFIFPSIFIFLLFFVFPIFYALFLSLHSTSMLSPPIFVGLRNYQELFHDKTFWMSIKNTFIYSLIFVSSVVSLSLFVAVVLNTKIRMRSIFRGLYFIPVICSVVVVALIWTWIYNSDVGVLNYFLRLVHLPPQNWLGNINMALVAIAIMAIWQSIGYYMVLYLAGLQGIPRQLYEAARIDGGSSWQVFWHVTLPLLTPTILFVVIISTITSFQVFDAIYIMSSGGPANSTSTISWLIYQTGFQGFRMGMASAVGYILFAIIFVLSFVELRTLGLRFRY